MTELSSKACYLAVIPAAGKGARMEGNTRKQYLVCAGKTILEHAAYKLLDSGLTKIIIPVSDDDDQWSGLALAQDDRVHFVRGGDTRSASVLNGISKLLEVYSENDWVMVHDAARPCVSVMDVIKLNDSLRDHQVGGLLAVRISDTIKRESPYQVGKVECTVDRAGLWRALTPQMFRLGMLSGAIKSCIEKDITITDESSAIESMGYKPLLIEGSSDNVKVTWPGDLKLVEYYLDQQAGTQ